MKYNVYLLMTPWFTSSEILPFSLERLCRFLQIMRALCLAHVHLYHGRIHLEIIPLKISFFFFVLSFPNISSYSRIKFVIQSFDKIK